MRVDFGKHQNLTSPRMNKSPRLAKALQKVFGYTNVGNYARAKVFVDLMNELPLVQFRKVLDLGCGYGEYSFMLSDGLKHAQITALDTDDHKIDLIKKIIKRENITNVHPVATKIERLKDDDYDFIFSIDVFEHILEENMPFKAAFDRLRPGGYLLIKMPSKDQHTVLPENWFEQHQEWLDDEHIGQVYELTDLEERFEREGFNIVYSAYSDGWWSRLGWEMGHLSRKAGAVTQLATLPLAKSFVLLDRQRKSLQKGNTIQVIGQKP